MRSCASARLWARAALAALLLCATAASFCPAQEEEDLTAEAGLLNMRLKNGRDLFNGLKFPEAIAEFDAIVQAYDAGKLQDAGPEGAKMVSEALDLRARAYFNLGDRSRAATDFEKLLSVNIDYQFDKQKVSPKVVELFEQVKRENMGTLTLITDPPGADAFLNEDSIGLTPLVSRPVMKGTPKLKILLKGFREHEENLVLNPRAEVRREIKLTPSQRILQFITEPAGVNVLVDGKLAGTTFGALPHELQSLAKDAGLDPSRSSAPLLVPHVDPGAHEVRFEKECFGSQSRSIQVKLDLERNDPQTFQPIALKEERGQIRIVSHPSGAEVLVDGKPVGTTPLQQAVVCAGERDIRLVKKGEGTWFERVRVKSDAVNLIDATLRPTLVYLGTFRLDEWKRLSWSDEDKLLLDKLATLRTVNQVHSEDQLKQFRSVLLTDLAPPEESEKLRKGAGLPASRVLEGLGKFQADLLLWGVSVQEQGGKGYQSLYLYSAEQPSPDVTRLDLAKETDLTEYLAHLDRPPDLKRPWIGATFADTLLGEGPVTVRVVKSGPAAQAGLLPSDQILTMNSRKASDAGALSVAQAGWKAGEAVSLSIRRAGQNKNLTFNVGESPVLIPLYSPDLLYNKALADYRQMSRGGDQPLDRALAQVNLGLAFMHFKAYDKALSESFSVVNLPAGSGISRGTVRYYQGLCYLKKDLVPEARTAFQEAAAASEATLESNDGPPVAARAKNLLQ
jgi:tetratricopeptide (TPR) repeat protein